MEEREELRGVPNPGGRGLLLTDQSGIEEDAIPSGVRTLCLKGGPRTTYLYLTWLTPARIPVTAGPGTQIHP